MKKLVLASCLFAFATYVFSSPGHDHGESALVMENEPSPRVVMQADLFEAVGILKGRTLEIFIDHAATNAPVHNAQIELVLNGEKVAVELHAEGEFDAIVPGSMIGQNMAVAMRVDAGDQSDMLSGELMLPEAGHSNTNEEHGHLTEYILLGGFALFALGFIAWFFQRRNNKGVKQS